MRPLRTTTFFAATGLAVGLVCVGVAFATIGVTNPPGCPPGLYNPIAPGGGGNDTLTGTVVADYIIDSGGSNIVNGNGGNDCILLTNSLVDTVTTLGGDDYIDAGGGDNVIDAGGGNNTVVAGGGDDHVTTGSGNDTITVDGGANVIDAGEGTNVITTGAGGDDITTGSGNDTITASGGDNTIHAGEGANNITTTGGDDHIFTGSGNDTIDAGGGANVVDAGDGTNSVTTAGGSDTITTGDGDDLIAAGGGANGATTPISGGAGSDTITTAGGDDIVHGGPGNDLINVGGGSDTVQGNAGNDTITWTTTGIDSIQGNTGCDTLNGVLEIGDICDPQVTMNQAATQTDPTGTSPIHYTVVFDEPVVGFDGSDVSFTGSTVGGTLSAIATLVTSTDTAETYDVEVSGMTTPGNVVASLPAGIAKNGTAAIGPAASGNQASTFSDKTVAWSGVAPPDDDNDGVVNADDDCPGTPAGRLVDANGCEFDDDSDGVVNDDDDCPGTPAGRTVDTNGCEFDDDGDLVVNADDLCPTTPAGATVDSNGCKTPRDTMTTVSCTTPRTVGQGSTCTATVVDTGEGTPSTPAGTVTFGSSSFWGGFTPGTSCTLNVSGQCSRTYTPTQVDGGTHTITGTYAPASLDPHAASVSDGFDITVGKVATSLLYNGTQVVPLGTTFGAKAILSSAAASCQTGKTISFSLDDNPTTAALGDGPYSLGSISPTAASGQSPTKNVATTGWLSGTYTLTSTFAEDANCLGSTDLATLTVQDPGDAADGGGWYSNNGRINFGFTVKKQKDGSYKGQLLLINNGKWRLKGVLSSYVKTSTKAGKASGNGDLFTWNSTLGTWVLVQANVAYVASFEDSGSGGKNSTDKFGIDVHYTPTAGQPSSPNSAPIGIKGGDIRVS